MDTDRITNLRHTGTVVYFSFSGLLNVYTFIQYLMQVPLYLFATLSLSERNLQLKVNYDKYFSFFNLFISNIFVSNL